MTIVEQADHICPGYHTTSWVALLQYLLVAVQNDRETLSLLQSESSDSHHKFAVEPHYEAVLFAGIPQKMEQEMHSEKAGRFGAIPRT